MMNEKGYDAENLQKLATFLAYAEVDGVTFDMFRFTEWSRYGGDENSVNSTNCGTSGCAVGWATMLWPKPVGMIFSEFSHKILINSKKSVYCSNLWDWCFAEEWAVIDNTRLGAARRIQYLLNHNGQVPECDFNAEAADLYANTVVKRDDPLKPDVVREANRPHPLIVELIDKISREPKPVVPAKTT